MSVCARYFVFLNMHQLNRPGSHGCKRCAVTTSSERLLQDHWVVPSRPRKRQTVKVVPSNLVKVRPLNGSLKVGRISLRILIAAASPSSLDSVPAVRQCTRPMLRPCETLDGIVFNARPTIRAGTP